MSTRKKKNGRTTPMETSSFENSSLQVSVELDNTALRLKNKQLTQAIAKLQAENAQQYLQYTKLQEDFFNLHSTHVNLKNVLATIDSTIKTVLPKFVDVSKAFTNITQLCSVGKQVVGAKDQQTLAVQPHAVNGHVLQHPTVSLSRLNNAPNERRSHRNRSTQEERPENDSLHNSGAENRTTEEELGNGNNENEQNGYDVERIIYRRRRNIPIDVLNIETLEQQDDVEMGTEQDINDYCSRLLTIQEEDESISSNNPVSTIVSREVKIYIDRLPSDFVRRNVIVNNNNNSTEDTANSGTSFLENDSVSNAAVIHETVYRRTMSPLKKRQSDYFREPSTLIQSTSVPTISTLPHSTLHMENLEMPESVSIIQDVPSCSVSKIDENTTCESVQCHKLNVLNSLGLSPIVPGLATSTPMLLSPLIQKEDLKSTPKKHRNLSSINMKRGGSNDLNKVAKVILNRMTLGKNSAASSLQTMGNILNDSSRSSRLSKRKKPDHIEVSDSSSSSSDRSASKENIDTSNKNVITKKEKRSVSFRNDSILTYKRIKAINTRRIPSSSSSSSSKSEDSENDTSAHQNVRPSPIGNIGRRKLKMTSTKVFKRLSKSPAKSPRPKRAARPASLKEPTLNKKMRRSR